MFLKNIIAVFVVMMLLYVAGACNGGKDTKDDADKSDSVVIAQGAVSFERNCASCHNFRQDGIGPQLNGITGKVSSNWLHTFIKDPAGTIASGDKYAVALHQKYKAMMPSFTALGNEEIDALIAFLATKGSAAPADKPDTTVITNPFPGSIPLSNIEITLDSLTQIPASAASKELLTRITKLCSQPGTDDLFVVDLRGKLYRIKKNKPVVYMDMQRLKPHFISEPGMATGFGSFAFHPAFKKNGLLYTTHTEAAGTSIADFKYPDSIKVTLQWVLTEWKTANPQAPVFSGVGRELLRINMVSGMHGVQEITFRSDARLTDTDYGLLYIGIGDGGSVEHGFPVLAHNLKNIWGTVIRIDPAGNNGRNKQYGIPPDNPFTHTADTEILKEIYSYGFRNPHRVSWTNDGKMLVFNIGQHDIESIYEVEPGQDYGWPLREGNFAINPYGDINKIHALLPNDTIHHIKYPVAAYDHDEGKAIAGGFDYTGSIQPLKNKIIFGDIPTGRIFYIEKNTIGAGRLAPVKELNIAINGMPETLIKATHNERAELRLGKDAKGELYVLTKVDGKIYKITNAKVKEK